MVNFNDLKVTPDVRNKLSILFTMQFSIAENNISEYLTFKDRIAPGNYNYTNYYQLDHLNIVRCPDNKPMMGVFNFSIKNKLKLCKLLNLDPSKHQVNGIRVYANTDVPMHIDLNRGNIERDNPIYSIMLTGKEAMVFFSNRNDGSRLVAIPPLSEFIMYPTQIQHGAITKDEPLDVLQITLEEMY